MINPMTFESNGADQYLTWSRDEASVIDAILSARTSNELRRASSETHAENVGRGSNPLYISDFLGEMNTGTLKIKLLRGYVAGRYFEMVDEMVTGYNHTSGKGYIKIVCWGWRSDGNPLVRLLTPSEMLPNIGQQGGRGLPVNGTPRDIAARDGEKHSIFSKAYIVWNPKEVPSKVVITSENSNTLNIDVNKISPNNSSTEPTHPYSINHEEWAHRIEGYYQDFDVPLDYTNVVVGDKRTGVFFVEGGSIKNDEGVDPVELSLGSFSHFDVSKSRYTTWGATTAGISRRDANYASSGFAGITASYPTYWDPTIKELFTMIDKYHSTNTLMTYPPTGGTTNDNGITMPPIRGGVGGDVNKYSNNNLSVRYNYGMNQHYPAFVESQLSLQSLAMLDNVLVKSPGSTVETFSSFDPQYGVLRVSDFNITVSSVRYIDADTYNRNKPTGGLMMSYNSLMQDNKSGVIEVTASVSYQPLRYLITGSLYTGSSQKWLSLKYMYPRTIRVYIGTRSITKYTRNNYGDYRAELFVPDFDTVKKWVRESGASEYEVFKRLITPTVIADVLQYENNESTIDRLNELNKLLVEYQKLNKGVFYRLHWGSRGVNVDKPILQ